ncbi:hypothetical protein WME99_00975 [Sorangium sp. So ce136]|uniref:hypothetical protein n=1 Tax=Sorangium sp. So ce136 TaxID=3133284 RepID=UPI003F12376F
MSVTYNSDNDTYELRGEKYRVEAKTRSGHNHVHIIRLSDQAEANTVDAFTIGDGPEELEWTSVGPEIPMSREDAKAIYRSWRAGLGNDAATLLRRLMRLTEGHEGARREVQLAAAEAMTRVDDWIEDYWARKSLPTRSMDDPTYAALMQLDAKLGLEARVSDQKPSDEQPKDGVRTAFELELQRGSRKAAAIIARRLRVSLPAIAPDVAEQARELLGKPQIVAALMPSGHVAITVPDVRCAKVPQGFDPQIGQAYVLRDGDDAVTLSVDPPREPWKAPITHLSRCNIGDFVFAPMGVGKDVNGNSWPVWEVVDVP